MQSTVNSSLPLVSVIALCYNHARFVTACLESLRTQCYPNIEVILFDDASKDNSVEVIRDWIEQYNFNCQFFPHLTNKGICSTLNEALALVKGKYISLIATDDTWEVDRLLKSVSYLESSSEEIGVVFTDVYQMDEEGVRLPRTFLQSILNNKKVPQGRILNELIEGNFVPAMGALIRRSVYEKIGHYNEQLLYEDWDFWLRAAECFEIHYVDHVSANYRIVSTSMARTHLANDSPAALYTYYLIHYRLCNVPNLSEMTRTLVYERLANTARELYARNHPALPRLSCRFIRRSKKPASYLMAILCALGIPWKLYGKWSGYWRWRIDIIFSRINKK
jgi:glycosyltransferase involved in cell wall biosynthesis